MEVHWFNASKSKSQLNASNESDLDPFAAKHDADGLKCRVVD